MTYSSEPHIHDVSQNSRIVRISDENFSFKDYHIDDDKVVGLQIIEAYGKRHSPDIVVLQHMENGELETRRESEKFYIDTSNPPSFFVIKGGDLRRFEVEGLSMEWPLEKLKASHLKYLARATDEEVLVQITETGDVILDDDNVVSLKAHGVERFKLRKQSKIVSVRYKEETVELERREWSTEELIEKFGVPAGYKLVLIGDDCEFVEMKPGAKIKVKEGMEFTSHAPRGQSS